jgi:hypothetical protein
VGSQLGVGQAGAIEASITNNTITGMEGIGIYLSAGTAEVVCFRGKPEARAG